MRLPLRAPRATSRSYHACTGCGLCVLACPVWRQHRDVWLTPHGRARALQAGASAGELADSAASCLMCGACEPACPEEIGLLDMVRELRAALPAWSARAETVRPPEPATKSTPRSRRLLLPGPVLESMPELLASVVEALGGIEAHLDDGRDLAWALEAGVPVDAGRRQRFLAPLDGRRELVVVEGVLHRALRGWCPKARVQGLAEALVGADAIAEALGPGDLLVVDSRAFHADHPRLALLFDRLRRRTGCLVNLDLLRLALPTGAASLPHRLGSEGLEERLEWILHGYHVRRVVVESPADLGAFAAVAPRHGLEVAHLASLAAEAVA